MKMYGGVEIYLHAFLDEEGPEMYGDTSLLNMHLSCQGCFSTGYCV